jgi:hypothetical protein
LEFPPGVFWRVRALFEFLGGPSPMVGHVFEGKLTEFGS